MNPASIYVEAAYALAVAGAAIIVPWLALIVAAVFLLGLAIVAWRTQAEPKPQ